MMVSWRNRIIETFALAVARLYVVADPDRLLLDEVVVAGLEYRGFTAVSFSDPIAFRYIYESQYRPFIFAQPRERGLIVRWDSQELENIPYDLYASGRHVAIGLAELFSNLSYPVVTALDGDGLELLYKAQQTHNPGSMSVSATKSFILRHVYRITPETITHPAELLTMLLRRHQQDVSLPPLLDDYLIDILTGSQRFQTWPLAQIVPDKNTFFVFLQERWPLYVKNAAGLISDRVKERPSDELRIPGPENLPFDDADVRAYTNDLFLRGLLQPIVVSQSEQMKVEPWARVGVATNLQEHDLGRLQGLLEITPSRLPVAEASYREWLAFGSLWAELNMLRNSNYGDLHPGLAEEFAYQQRLVDEAFEAWVARYFATLHNLPASPPVMVHHIARYIARVKAEHSKRIALVVVDGLSLEQWSAMLPILEVQCPSLTFSTAAVFAWIPTITSISRQAIFAGKPPLSFQQTLFSTDNDKKLWTAFWAEQGVPSNAVDYMRGLSHDASLPDVDEFIARPGLEVVGMVVNAVDEIMHGMQLGAIGMHNQARQWANARYLSELIDKLQEANFTVFLTSDHGNVEAVGKGQPGEGAVASMRGERVRIYQSEDLRNRTKELFTGSIAWPPVGLPEDFLPLLAPGRTAFVRQGKTVVTHGGISIEELIVPFVQVKRRKS